MARDLLDKLKQEAWRAETSRAADEGKESLLDKFLGIWETPEDFDAGATYRNVKQFFSPKNKPLGDPAAWSRWHNELSPLRASET